MILIIATLYNVVQYLMVFNCCEYNTVSQPLCCLATHRTRKKIDGLLQQFSALEQEFVKTKKPRIAVLVVSFMVTMYNTLYM